MTRPRRTQRVRVHRAARAPELSSLRARAAVLCALAHGGRPDLCVDVVIVDDARLCELHARFLGDDSPTDVMAFDLEDADEVAPAHEDAQDGGPQAEIYASVERARAVAAARGVPAAQELALYLVHGALHLCGHRDGSAAERRRMRAAEARVMEELGYPPDRAPRQRGA